MTRAQFNAMKPGDKVKVTGRMSGHGYRMGGIYPLLRKSSDKAYLLTDEINGVGDRLSSYFANMEDIELYAMTRNAEVKELMAANEQLLLKIEDNKARIEWLKTYKDTLDEVLQKAFISLGIADKHLIKKFYTELTKEGIDPNFVKVKPPTSAPIGAGGIVVTTNSGIPIGVVPTPLHSVSTDFIDSMTVSE